MLSRLFSIKSSINFLSKKKITFALSAILVVASLVMSFTRGLNFGIDFIGGILIEAKFEKQPDIAKMRQVLAEQKIGDISLQSFGGGNEVLIRVGQKSVESNEKIAVMNTIKEAIKANFEGEIDYRKEEYVGPKVGSELIKSAAISLMLAFIAILIYISIRFEWQYGVGAIVALFHDVILTVGFFSITQLEFNLSSIAAILTIIGYSINDSVVIFDRIRENVRKFKKMTIEEVLNSSINSNLTRTMITSFTTIVALIALVLMGGEVIKSFSLSALFGVIVGTYSSIYIASPILSYMDLRSSKASEKPVVA